MSFDGCRISHVHELFIAFSLFVCVPSSHGLPLKGSGVTVFGGYHPLLGNLVMKHGGHK